MVFPLIFPLQVQNAFHKTFHPGGAVLFHALCKVAVSIKSKGGGGVAEIALYGLYIISGADGVHGISVAQIMEADTSKTSGPQDGRELLFRFPLVQRLPYLRREYHMMLIIPQRPRL